MSSLKVAISSFKTKARSEKPQKLTEIEKETRRRMINTAISRKNEVLSIINTLNVEQIKVRLFSILLETTGNKDLLGDDYVLLSELLSQQKYNYLNNFIQHFLLWLEFLDDYGDEDLKLYNQIVNALNSHLKKIKKKDVVSSKIEGEEDAIEVEEEGDDMKPPAIVRLEERLKKSTDRKLKNLSDEKTLVLKLAQNVMLSMIGDKSHSFVLLNSKEEVIGDAREVSKILYIENKSDTESDKINLHLKKCAALIKTELDKPPAERKDLLKIGFDYLIGRDLGMDQWTKELFFGTLFLNFEAIVKQHVGKKVPMYTDVDGDTRELKNIEQLEIPSRKAIQLAARSGKKLKQTLKAYKLDGSNYNFIFNSEEGYLIPYSYIEGNLRAAALVEFTPKSVYKMTSLEWEDGKKKIIAQHELLISALETLDSEELDTNKKREFSKLRTVLVGSIRELQEEIKLLQLEYNDLTTPVEAELYVKLKEGKEKLKEYCKQVAEFYTLINNIDSARIVITQIFGEDDMFIRSVLSELTKLNEFKRTSSSARSVRSDISDRSKILFRILDGDTYENAQSEVSDIGMIRSQSVPEQSQTQNYSRGNSAAPDVEMQTDQLTERNVRSLAAASGLPTIGEGREGGGRKPKHCKNTGIKKEILGKDRCIYKMPGDRKEYVKYKGELVTVKEFKELHKKPTKPKSKPKKEEKPTKAKSKPKKEEKPTKPNPKSKKEEKPTKPKPNPKPKKEEKSTKPKSKSTKK